MRKILSLLVLFSALNAYAQQTKELVKVWETDSVIATPESVLPDPDKKVLYVSLIDGEPWGADGKGGIATLGMDGKIINAYWVKGLNAPKGLGLFKNKLYAADLSNIVVIDTKTGKIEKTIPVEGAKKLNDVTVDRKGGVFVSDSETGKVHKLENGKVSVYLDGFGGLNGLKAEGSNLYVLADKVLYKVEADKKRTKISEEFLQGGDGVEPVAEGGFVVSCWGGLIYYVSPEGKNELLLDVRDKKINTADIGYTPGDRTIYVPTFFKKSVAAYSLKL